MYRYHGGNNGVDGRGCHAAVGWQTPAKTAFDDVMSLISGRWREGRGGIMSNSMHAF